MDDLKKKPSAIERELNFVILLNNNYTEPKKGSILKSKLKNTTMIDYISHKLNYISQKFRYIPKEKKEREHIKNISRVLTEKEYFIIKNRFTDEKDLFTEIINNDNFCNLDLSYVNDVIYNSDFIIFINNLEKVNEKTPFSPLCMAFINLENENFTSYDKEIPIIKKYLYISIFCSDQNYGECGRYLMSSIKHIAYLLGCSEIRLESVDTQNTLNFYNKNNFNMITDYNHYYIVNNEDAIYKPLPNIEGDVQIKKDENEGGKMKKNKRKNKSKTIKLKTIKLKTITRNVKNNYK